MITMGTHVGTHIDAFAHVSHDGRLLDGSDAGTPRPAAASSSWAPTPSSPACAGACCWTSPRPGHAGRLRPRLRDHRGGPRGDRGGAGHGPRARATSSSIRSGWGAPLRRTVGRDLRRQGHRRAGRRRGGCDLAGGPRTVHAAGADTIAFEQLPAGAGHSVLPAHRVLLVEQGVYIIEALALEELAAAGVHESTVRAVAAAAVRRHRLARPPAGRGPPCLRPSPPRRWPPRSAAFAVRDPGRGRCRPRCRSACAARPRRARPVRRRPPAADQRVRGRPACGDQGGRGQATASGVAERAPRHAGGVPQRGAGPLARLRRHPPAVGAAPERAGRPRRAGRRARRAGADGARRGARRRRRHRGRASGSAWPGTTEDLGNSVFFEHGQHATSICGAMGGAVAAALLLGLDEDGVVHALGVPASMAAGSSRRTAPAAPSSGCTAAGRPTPRSARRSWCSRGFTGPPTVLEGRFGFFEAFLRGESTRRRDHRRARRRVGGARHLLQALPGQPLHARRDRRGPRAARAGRPARPDRVDRPSACPRRWCARSASRSRASARPRTATRRSSAARTRWSPGCSAGPGSAPALDDYTDELAQDPERRG